MVLMVAREWEKFGPVDGNLLHQVRTFAHGHQGNTLVDQVSSLVDQGCGEVEGITDLVVAVVGGDLPITNHKEPLKAVQVAHAAWAVERRWDANDYP